MPDLLGQIANPQLADVAGALDYRAKKMQEDEQRRREIQFNELAGKALSTGLRPDSVLAQLAANDPAKYVMFTKTMGLDPANGAEGTSLIDDVAAIYNHSVTGPEDGIAFVDSLISSRSQLGLDTKRLESLSELGKNNPQAFINSISALHNTFNPSKPIELSKGSILIDSAGNKIAENIDRTSESFTLGEGQTRFDSQGRPIASVAKSADQKVSDTADSRRQINQDLSKITNPVNDVVLAAKDLEALKTSNSPASQVAAVFKFMKSLDPQSAVRETEQGQVYEAQGAAASIAAKLNKMIGEGGLNQKGFDDLVNTAKHLANSSIDNAKGQVDSYLSTYESTIPESFKSKLVDRIPKRFDVDSSSTQAASKKTGGTLMIDANGNKAYVYPDGTHEEVQ